MKVKIIWFFLLISWCLNAKDPTYPTISIPATTEIADQTKLALRQVGHELLKTVGNDSTAIQPIQQIEPHIFLLPLAQSFNYDTLPYLLHQALTILEIEQAAYYVTVKDCQTDTIVLGYDSRQFLAQKVPCIGRHQYVDCNHIYLTFPNRKTKLANNNYYSTWGLFILSLMGVGWYYWKKKSKTIKNEIPTNKEVSTSPSTPLHSVGQSQLDVANQQIIIKGVTTTLTFRETKLLHYFVAHANQLLNREQILEQVWGNEGVIVGRSLDVFVSRLRKILKTDTTIEIKTVHGVGYRLEVKGKG